MIRAASRSLALASLALVLAACAPALDALGLAGPPTSFVVLPSGERCAHAGEGATLAFDGDRLSWTCEPDEGAPRGLLGTPVATEDGTGLTWRLGVARTVTEGGFVLARDERVTARVWALELASGERCAFAGEGATLAFEGRRVAYTCDGDAVVLSPLETDARGVVAARAVVARGAAGFEVRRPERVRVVAIDHAEPQGAGLADGVWALQRLVRADGTALVPDEPERYTLAFLADGAAAVRADCNRGVGAYEVAGERLTFAPFGLTRALCPAGSIDVAYVMALSSTAGFALDGDALVLRTEAGDLLSFQRLAN